MSHAEAADRPLWEDALADYLNAGYRPEQAWWLLINERGFADPGIHPILRAQTRLIRERRVKKGGAPVAARLPSKIPEPCPTAWTLTGDRWGILGDLHFPLVDWAFLGTICQVLRREGVEDVTLAGDTFNFDYYSKYDRTIEDGGLGLEREAAVRGLDMLAEKVKRIWVILGNHDARILKRLNGVPFGVDTDIILLFLGGQRGGAVQLSSLDHHYLDTPAGRWIVAHGADYSQHPGKVAADLALDEHCHAIVHHAHQVGITTDRTNRYIAIQNGMVADPRKVRYVTQQKRAGRRQMAQGFTLLLDGRPYVFGGPNLPSGLQVRP